tara:strand:+ start:398 stop:718 length:321 start_codon:yes stop_codon:yes gene_type:complete
MKSNSTVIDKNGSNTKKKPRKTPPPPKYKVIYHNDDYTPMEFVTWSLRAFFNKDEHEANSITLEIHKLGAACVGLYDYQIAEQKIYEVLESAREHEYPLKVTGETE